MAGRLKIGAQAIALATVAGLLALLVWKLVNGGGATETPMNFTLSRLDRPGKLELASLRGKVVVLNFWASWCKPCKQEASTLETAWNRYRSQGVVVVGVDVNDFSGDARRFMRRYGITYPVVHDGSGSTIGPYAIGGYPETRFVDRRGRFAGQHISGAVSASDLAQNIRVALRS